MESYKHYIGITSQIPFCSTPLRLDTYNQCQFSCGYCYASTRQGYGRQSALKAISPKALEDRFKRIEKGIIQSAADEFIKRKIPFQIGGMSDPFILREELVESTKNILKLLSKNNYPYIISTKSDLLSRDDYLEIIKSSNAYIRFSTTVVNEKYRGHIDRGCPDIVDLYRACEKLSSAGVPVAFRFQPIIPGYESAASKMIKNSHDSGAKHITAEYLKVPLDADRMFSNSLQKILGAKPIEMYKKMKAKIQGREYVLPLSYRAPNLIEMHRNVKNLGMTFGFADNDLLLHSDGDSCCGAANLYLKNANFFNANIVGIAKKKKLGQKIKYSDIKNQWVPYSQISPYLNSTARLPSRDKSKPDWPIYLKEMWLSQQGIYTPDYFDGIRSLTEIDEHGLPIYQRATSGFEKILRVGKAHNKSVPS